MKKLANMMLHPFPPQEELISHGLEPVGKPLGTRDGLAKLSPDELIVVATDMIGQAQMLGAEAVLVGGLTSLHYHLISIAHGLGWDVWENLSHSYRECLACHWKEGGRFDICPRCGASVVAKYEFAGLRRVLQTPVKDIVGHL